MHASRIYAVLRRLPACAPSVKRASSYVIYMSSVIGFLALIAIYVALVGVASFIEMPAGRGFGAFQLNALIRVGSLAAAAVALVFGHGLEFPAAGYLLAGLGIGLLSGVGSMLYCFGLEYLPVSLVVTLSNLYIVITVLLGIAVLHEPATGLKIAGLVCIFALVLVLAHAPARPYRKSRSPLGQ